MKTFASIVLVLAACGGKSAGPVKPAGPPAGQLTPELVAFHDVLSPRWHAEGPTRRPETCAALPDFAQKAQAVKAAAVPDAVDPQRWADAGLALEASVGQLEASCAGGDETAFANAFTAVHDAYHQAMSLIVGEHDQGDAIGTHHGEGEHMGEGHEAGAGHGGQTGQH